MPVQTGLETYPASCTTDTGSFPGVTRPGRGADHAHSSSAEVPNELELYLYFTSVAAKACHGVIMNIYLYFATGNGLMYDAVTCWFYLL